MAPSIEVLEVTKRFSGPTRTTALRNVSLELGAGSAVSVIGPNGAGKSTLLGAIAGVVSPDLGRVRRTGRCSALLELGAGFHPDLTGRENLDLALALAGVGPRRRPALRREAEEIAGIGDGVHLAHRHLSNGMVARLACSAALVTDPQILLIDEVLGVGDAGFQRTMIGRVAEMVDRGCILVLVTHSLALAATVTRRSVWLDHGRIRADGPSDRVLAEYEAASVGWGVRAPSGDLVIEELAVHPTRIEPGDPISIRARLRCHADTPPCRIRVELRPAIGDDDLWMRSIDESAETRRMNLLAASPVIMTPRLSSGTHELRIELDRVPITATAAELSVVVADANREVLDELTTDLDIGSVMLRPSFLLEAHLDPQIPCLRR